MALKMRIKPLICGRKEINVVLSDLHYGDVSGIDLLNPWTTAKADTQPHRADRTSQLRGGGAGDEGAPPYISKPDQPEELSLVIKRPSTPPEGKEIDDLRRRLDQNSASTRSSAIPSRCEMSTRIQRAAAGRFNLYLVLGESGTGKGSSRRRCITTAVEEGPVRRRQLRRSPGHAGRIRTLRDSPAAPHRRDATAAWVAFEQADRRDSSIDEIGPPRLACRSDPCGVGSRR